MSSTDITLLGAIAGFTIFLGLPLGRVTSPAPRLRALLTALAIGILVFLLWDVLTHAWDPIDAALSAHRFASATGHGAVFAACLTAGLLGLVYVGHRSRRNHRNYGGGPGAASMNELNTTTATRASELGSLALMIAIGIGLHNFAEGLAIGSSAAAGDLQLAVLLIIGFGLHNATEGFGIVAPLAAADTRPSWTRLALLGLIGGGPTFLGTIIGQQFTNTTLSIAFLTLAAGSILYVVIELLAVARTSGMKQVVTVGILTGVILGFLTDAVVTAAGA
ncbi:MAG: ZIP family metal transporter [Gordonia polyisoprenivorans]|nr:ZIP family metal transporter [Gordonia polyisoprenivorans]